MRAIVFCVALAACGYEAPAATTTPRFMDLETTVSDWQSATDADRHYSLRRYAHVAFPVAREDQLDDLADRYAICLDNKLLALAASDKIGRTLVRCDQIVGPYPS